MINNEIKNVELSDINSNDTAALIKLYLEQAVPLDRLPYTLEMDKLHRFFVEKTGKTVQPGHLYHILIKFRKRGLLPKLRKEDQD